jgi:hypothetical protein
MNIMYLFYLNVDLGQSIILTVHQRLRGAELKINYIFSKRKKKQLNFTGVLRSELLDLLTLPLIRTSN